MSDRTLTLTGRVVATLSVIVAVVAVLVVLRLGSPLIDAAFLLALLAIGIGAVGWVTVGAQPRNGVVWALIAASFFAAIAGGSAATFTAVAPEWIRQLSDPELFALSPSQLPTDAAITLNPLIWAWIPAFLLILTVVLQLFPDGQPPSPRWRWLTWFSLGTIAVGVVVIAWSAWPTSTLAFDTSASDISDMALVWIGIAYIAWLGAATVAVVGSMTAIVVRYRRSSGDTRHQIRWIMWAGAIFAVAMFLVILEQEGDFVQLDERVVQLTWTAAMLVVIASFGVAITRYRLYDIDVVISRTVTYGALAIFITAVYVTIVVGVGSLIGGGDEPNPALAIGATALVALLFEPVRSRLQGFANRLVYGQRSTPYEVLARFSKRAAAAEQDDEMLQRIPRLIVDGTGASDATLWTVNGENLQPAAWWPEEDEPLDALPLPADGQWTDPLADYSVPVEHGGELLGVLSLTASRGESITPTEQELVQNLAGGLGLALRNARLTEDLRDQVTQLAASRERILAAADEARRDLERDLDMGPQQELVAVKVKLGVVKAQAAAANATDTHAVLSQLEDETGNAIESVRDFARGVYPPLLEAEGLAAAVSAEADKAALPVTIETNDVGRYTREVETAVFFSTLEALQNAAKYAEASRARVEIRQEGERITFEVSDDGRGFDPAQATAGTGITSMVDRLDAAGGKLSIDSAPGRGTSVRGSVPATVREPLSV